MVMFACQRDSFQKTLYSKVISCEKEPGGSSMFYEVVCEDSILFPEGGGQPWDTGFINDIPVDRVLRRGDVAVMYVKKSVEVGQEVKQTINWDRRFDHMQQHSGQHLITAVINIESKIDTTSWWLGEKISYIELNTRQLSTDQISNIESLVNEKIIKQIPVNMKLCEPGDISLQNARTRGLPKDVKGPIRIIEIDGLESDLCCGTHVSNLAQLQCIKLLYAEKGKKDRTNLFFICGNRVLNYLRQCQKREETLTKLLKSEPESHGELVLKLQQNLKVSNKKLNALIQEVAANEANKFLNIKPQPIYYSHYKNIDSEYLDCFWRMLRDYEKIDETFFMLAAGDEAGNLRLQGKEKDIISLGPQIAELLCGKGAVQGTRFQAKVLKLSNFKKAEEVLKDYFKC